MGKLSPSALELQVLGVLWEKGHATAREVLESMPDQKTRAYTTVLTVLQGMERKGLVGRETSGVTHIWNAKVSREQTATPVLRELIQNAFCGRPAMALQQLLGSDQISAAEIDELRQLLDDAKGGEL
ncbi:BlaI/MecI/CopY family transcriptional regulator [Pontiellaceae bacterium B1224]|nr:BlaI/MecI/CopY family transcriptional regulator [Pontiellaceae bacterium B1224]